MNYQLDSFKIVHHARYLEMLEEARWLYFYENKLINELHGRGLFHVIVNINIDYRSSAAFGEIVIINTELSRATERSVAFKQTIYKNKKLIIEADITNVFMDNSNGNPVKAQEMTSFWDDLNKLF